MSNVDSHISIYWINVGYLFKRRMKRTELFMLIYYARSILHSNKLDHAWLYKRWLVWLWNGWCTTERQTDRQTDTDMMTSQMVTQFIISKIKPKQEPTNDPQRFTVLLFPIFCFSPLFSLAMQIQVDEYSFKRSPSTYTVWHRLQWIRNVCVWVCGKIWCCGNV